MCDIWEAHEVVEVADHGHAPEVKEVLAQAAIAGAVALPLADAGQGVLDANPCA